MAKIINTRRLASISSRASVSLLGQNELCGLIPVTKLIEEWIIPNLVDEWIANQSHGGADDGVDEDNGNHL